MYFKTKNVRVDYVDEVTSPNAKQCAWTFLRLTDFEKVYAKKILQAAIPDKVIDDLNEYGQEWEKASDIYSSILGMLGYHEDVVHWRDSDYQPKVKEEKKPTEITVKIIVNADGTVTQVV